MSPRFVRTQLLRLAALGAVVFAAACGSDDVGAAKLKALKTGDKKPRIAEVIGQGPLTATTRADSNRLVQGHRLQKYVTGAQMHEILWYREKPGGLEDSITKRGETPIVITGDTLVGWGWSFFDKYSAKYGIPNPTRNRERIDSIARVQQEAGKAKP